MAELPHRRPTSPATAPTSSYAGATPTFRFTVAPPRSSDPDPPPSYDYLFPLISNELFEYQCLPDSSQYLRLLKISGTNSASTLSCHISSFEVSGAPSYEALSYTWGDPTALKPIYLNGKCFMVTFNLWSFLLQQQEEAKDVWFWIDAICINQNDNLEKGPQVQMMGLIYKQAESVLIWLNPVDKIAEKAIEFLRFAEDEFGSATVGEMLLASFKDIRTLINAIEQIFTCTYWNRSWVVQEVLLAKSPIVCCGSQRITWNALDFWTRNVDNLFPSMQKTQDQNMRERIKRFHAEHLFIDRNFYLMSEPLTLELLLERYKNTQSTDPRDAVFAFLSLEKIAPWKKAGVESIKPEYTKSPGEVYFQVLEYLIKTGQLSGAAFMRNLLKRMQINLDEESELMMSPQIFALKTGYFGTVTHCWIPKNLTHLGMPGCKYFRAEDERTKENVAGLAQDSIMSGDRVYTLFDGSLGFIMRQQPLLKAETAHISNGKGAGNLEFICKALAHRNEDSQPITENSVVSEEQARCVQQLVGIPGISQSVQDELLGTVTFQVNRIEIIEIFRQYGEAFRIFGRKLRKRAE